MVTRHLPGTPGTGGVAVRGPSLGFLFALPTAPSRGAQNGPFLHTQESCLIRSRLPGYDASSKGILRWWHPIDVWVIAGSCCLEPVQPPASALWEVL